MNASVCVYNDVVMRKIYKCELKINFSNVKAAQAVQNSRFIHK